jgi:hypothetical protein
MRIMKIWVKDIESISYVICMSATRIEIGLASAVLVRLQEIMVAVAQRLHIDNHISVENVESRSSSIGMSNIYLSSHQ